MTLAQQTDQTNNKEALKGVTDLTKLQITLSTGAIVFGGTLLELLLEPEEKIALPFGLLFTSWALLLASLFCGVFIMARYVTLVSRSQYNVHDITLRVLGAFQQLLFPSGIGIFAYFVFLALKGV